MKRNSGFTFIEIIVGVVILGIVTLVMNTTLITVFQNTRKAETLKEVKQNGDYALTVMEVRIREAKRIVFCNTSSLMIENMNGTYTNFTMSTDEKQVLQNNFEDAAGTILIDTANLTSPALTILTAATTPIPTLTFVCDIQPGKDTKVTLNFTLRPETASTQEEQSIQNFMAIFYLPNY